MNTQPIPRIVEKANPGFEEFTAADFAEPSQETDEQKNQRTALIEQIKFEQNRLNIDNAMLEFLTHQQTGAIRLDNVSIFNVMLFRDYLRGLESRQVPVIESPPYLDFVDSVLYIGGNNKGLIDSWVYFLTKSHAFAESGNWDVAIEQRFSKPVKYQAIIKGVGSVEALKWIEQNFDPKKHPPFHPIAEWKRSDPIVTAKHTEPMWVVKVDMHEIFKGSETEAKQRALESAQSPKTKIVSLISPDLKQKVYK